jgi:hypothetical protein
MSTPKERRIADEVEKTLQLFDRDAVLEENPFLAARIMAAQESLEDEPRSIFGLKSSLRYALFGLILVINLLTVVHYVRWDGAQNLQDKLVSELNEDFQVEQSQNVF